MPNPYLAGVSPKGPRTVRKILLLWVALIVMFLAIWQFLSPSPSARHTRRQVDDDYELDERPAPSPPLASSVLTPMTILPASLVVIFVFFTLRVQVRRDARLRAAEAKLLDDDIGGAVADAQAVLQKAQQIQRYQALMILAQCAERRADFAEASDLFAQAAAALPNMLGANAVKMQVEPYTNARRAFALAAADRLDEAEAVLARPPTCEAPPGTYAFTVRAHAVVDSKRGRYTQLLNGLATAHAALRESLPLRDRLLLRIVAAHARISLADARRAAAVGPTLVDPALAAWIGRVVPRTLPLLEGAS
jgi:hypothetical protein